MKKFVYDTSNQTRASDHAKIGKYLKELSQGDPEKIKAGTKTPKRYTVEIKELKVIHSIPQMAFFHVVCQIYALYTGHLLEEIKDEFKKECFYEIIRDKQGNEFKRLKSTSGLDKDEYSSLINNLLEWGRKHHPTVIVPKREDMDYRRWMEFEIDVKNQYEKEFSGW